MGEIWISLIQLRAPLREMVRQFAEKRSRTGVGVQHERFNLPLFKSLVSQLLGVTVDEAYGRRWTLQPPSSCMKNSQL